MLRLAAELFRVGNERFGTSSSAAPLSGHGPHATSILSTLVLWLVPCSGLYSENITFLLLLMQILQ